MKKIAKTIIENNLDITKVNKIRNTVRAVIIKGNKVYMLYSKTYDDYTFPGGGVKENENKVTTLKRELKEELGARKVTIIKPLGYLEEIRYGIKGNNTVYLQTSYYYLSKIDDIGSKTLNKRELTEKSTALYVDIEQAIAHNNNTLLTNSKHQQQGFKTVLLRENTMLNYLKNKIIK